MNDMTNATFMMYPIHRGRMVWMDESDLIEYFYPLHKIMENWVWLINNSAVGKYHFNNYKLDVLLNMITLYPDLKSKCTPDKFRPDAISKGYESYLAIQNLLKAEDNATV